MFEKRDSIKPSILVEESIKNLKKLLSRLDLLIKQKVALDVSLKEQKSTMNKILFKKLNTQNTLLIEMYIDQIESIESEITNIMKSDEDLEKNDELIRSVTGIGPIISAYLIAFTGNFSLFRNARQFACYGGVAPFPNSSGKRVASNSVSHIANKKIKSVLSFGVLQLYYMTRKLKIITIVRSKKENL